MLSNLEQHFAAESIHHEIPHEDDDDSSSSSSDDDSVQNNENEDGIPELPWTEEEDELLITHAEPMDPKNWILVAEQIPGRTNRECKRRWAHLQRSGDARSRSPWTKEEDELLKELVAQHGSKAWKLISSMMSGRKSKQCRERWTNVVDPKLNYAPWTEEEEQILILAQQELGNKWSQIEKRLPGRSANSIKNYWYSALRRGERKRAKMERKAMQPEGKKRRPRKPKTASDEELPTLVSSDAVADATLVEGEDKPKKKGTKRKKKDEVADEAAAVEGVKDAALAVDDNMGVEASANDESDEKPAKKAKKVKEIKAKKSSEGLDAVSIAMADVEVVTEEPKKTKAKKNTKNTIPAPATTTSTVEAIATATTTAASPLVENESVFEGNLASGSVDEDSTGKSGKRKIAKPTEEEKLLNKPALKKRRKNIAITDENLSS